MRGDTEIRAVVHDSRAVQAGRAVLLRPWCDGGRPRPRRRGGARRGGRPPGGAPAGHRPAAARHPVRAGRPRPGRGRVLGPPVRGAHDRRRHRHERQDDHHPPPRLDPRGARLAGRRARHALRRRGPPPRRRSCRRTWPSERDARPARGGDGGVVARAGHGACPGHAVRGGRVHQPVARPPRLPPRPGRLLRGEGVPLHPRVQRGGGGQRRRSRVARSCCDGPWCRRRATP